MTNHNITVPAKAGQETPSCVTAERPASVKESMESVQKYEKTNEEAQHFRDLKSRVKQWEDEMGRTPKENAYVIRQRTRGYY